MPLVDMGMATSGDYRNFFEHDGVNYSHTLDPKTGWPVSHNLGSVTVLHPSTAFADAVATAMSVMGPERARQLAEAQDLLVFAIMREQDGYSEWQSAAMEQYLESNLRNTHKPLK